VGCDFEVALHGAGLVRGHGEDVGEATSGLDDAFGGLFGLGDGGAGCNLCCSYGSDVGTCAREAGIEDAVVGARGGVVACGRINTDSIISGNAVVS
jgi:hypothetical protein